MKNILSILFAVCVCVAFASCSSGDYNANPANAGTTVVPPKDTTTPKDTTPVVIQPKHLTATGTMSATINGTAWAATATGITLDTGGTSKVFALVGTSGTGPSLQSVTITLIPYAGVKAYSQGVGLIGYFLGTAGTTSKTCTVTITTDDGAGNYKGTFTATSTANNNFIVTGVFNIHI